MEITFGIYASVAILVGWIPFFLHKIVTPYYDVPLQSTQAYECGFDPDGDATMPFYTPFYLIAISFVLFDLEMVFLFPWAMLLKTKATLSFLLSGWFFILILLAGLFYEWKQGVLTCLLYQ